VEAPLTERLSVKAEYLHVDLGRSTAAQTSNNVGAGLAFNQRAELSADIVRVGLNYRFIGADPWVSSTAMPVKAPVLKAPPRVASDWEVETGARLWLSSGSTGSPNPLVNQPPTPAIVVSRLIYKDLDAISGETFARVDHSSGLFVKGFLGAGGITGGKLNDEDFPGDSAYSNTLSTASGHLGYATIDAGYTFLRAPGAKVGAFVGFSHYTQHINTYGCTQLAGDAVCKVGFPANFLDAEDDRFDALRVGLST